MAYKLKVISVGVPITPKLFRKLRACQFRPRLKAGMSRDEANKAIDDAFQRFADCLKNKGLE